MTGANEQLRTPAETCFAADRMLGRLAKMLRLLGYDTLYSAGVTTSQLQEIARAGERFVLSRGQLEKRFAGLQNVFSVESENAAEQLREVVRRFQLDTRRGLWTRCTLCNAAIEPVEKASVESEVAPKVFLLYEEFYRCQACRHIYWRGSHVERIVRNLACVLGEPESRGN